MFEQKKEELQWIQIEVDPLIFGFILVIVLFICDHLASSYFCVDFYFTLFFLFLKQE